MQFVSFDKARCYALFFSEINFSFFFFFSLLIDQREVSSISKFWNEIRIVGKNVELSLILIISLVIKVQLFHFFLLDSLDEILFRKMVVNF